MSGQLRLNLIRALEHKHLVRLPLKQSATAPHQHRRLMKLSIFLETIWTTLVLPQLESMRLTPRMQIRVEQDRQVLPRPHQRQSLILRQARKHLLKPFLKGQTTRAQAPRISRIRFRKQTCETRVLDRKQYLNLLQKQ